MGYDAQYDALERAAEREMAALQDEIESLRERVEGIPDFQSQLAAKDALIAELVEALEKCGRYAAGLVCGAPDNAQESAELYELIMTEAHSALAKAKEAQA